jgi:hypothetical protein
MDFDDFFISQFVVAFWLSSKLLRHTCGPFAAHRLKLLIQENVTATFKGEEKSES